MRYIIGVIAVLALAVGGLALFGELRKDADASVAVRYASGDERVNKCVQNGYNQTRAMPRLRGPMCVRLITRMDLRFTPAERDNLMQSSYYKPRDREFLWQKSKPLTPRGMSAPADKMNRFSLESGPTCFKEAIAREQAGEVLR